MARVGGSEKKRESGKIPQRKSHRWRVKNKKAAFLSEHTCAKPHMRAGKYLEGGGHAAVWICPAMHSALGGGVWTIHTCKTMTARFTKGLEFRRFNNSKGVLCAHVET